MPPAGLEPATVGLTYHYDFRRQNIICLWSGLSLHPQLYCLGAARIVSTLARLSPASSGLPCQRVPRISAVHFVSFPTKAPVYAACSFGCSFDKHFCTHRTYILANTFEEYHKQYPNDAFLGDKPNKAVDIYLTLFANVLRNMKKL